MFNIFVILIQNMFENTHIGFKSKSTRNLKKSKKLFTLLSSNNLVKIGKILLQIATKLKIPTKTLIKNLFFDQFCGGETIEESQKCITQLKKHNIGSILDYSVEGNVKNVEKTKNEILKTIDAAKKNKYITFCVFKMSGLTSFENNKNCSNVIIS